MNNTTRYAQWASTTRLNMENGDWPMSRGEERAAVMIKDPLQKPTYEKLKVFYKAVAQLTLNHDVLTIAGRDFDSDDQYAVVYPNKLGAELEKVDPEWWKLQ